MKEAVSVKKGTCMVGKPNQVFPFANPSNEVWIRGAKTTGWNSKNK